MRAIAQRTRVAALAVAIGMATAGLAPTAASAATTFTRWSCTIDLAEAIGGDFGPPLPAEISTSNTEKQCAGNSANVKIKCTAQVPGWSLGKKVYHGFPCQISRTQCGTAAFVLANVTKLDITSGGVATLTCQPKDK